jgi:steroid delta-isomerase-like uncharacterized protein
MVARGATAPEGRCMRMTDEKRVARRIIEEAFNEGRLETVDELVASNFVGHDPALAEPTRGANGLKEVIAGYRTAFPDLDITVEEQFADGGRVATRWTAHGTNEGELWGIGPTGKEATVTGTTIDTIKDGKLVESRTNWDALGMMQQLGFVPAGTRT